MAADPSKTRCWRSAGPNRRTLLWRVTSSAVGSMWSGAETTSARTTAASKWRQPTAVCSATPRSCFRTCASTSARPDTANRRRSPWISRMDRAARSSTLRSAARPYCAISFSNMASAASTRSVSKAITPAARIASRRNGVTPARCWVAMRVASSANRANTGAGPSPCALDPPRANAHGRGDQAAGRCWSGPVIAAHCEASPAS